MRRLTCQKHVHVHVHETAIPAAVWPMWCIYCLLQLHMSSCLAELPGPAFMSENRYYYSMRDEYYMLSSLNIVFLRYDSA